MDQSIQQTIYLILKSEALDPTRERCNHYSSVYAGRDVYVECAVYVDHDVYAERDVYVERDVLRYNCVLSIDKPGSGY